jgi:hypothetical protein
MGTVGMDWGTGGSCHPFQEEPVLLWGGGSTPIPTAPTSPSNINSCIHLFIQSFPSLTVFSFSFLVLGLNPGPVPARLPTSLSYIPAVLITY